MMKKTILVAALALLAFDMSAKKKTEPKEEGFVFTTVKENPITSIKNHTCAITVMLPSRRAEASMTSCIV